MMRGRFGRRAAQALVGGSLIAAAGAGVAWGFWIATDNSNPAVAKADTLPKGATPITPTKASPNGNSVTVTFAQTLTSSGRTVTKYDIVRYPSGGGAGIAVPSSSCSTNAGVVSCTETVVPDGSWVYTDKPTLGTNWVGIESDASPAVLVDTTAPVVSNPAIGPSAGTSVGFVKKNSAYFVYASVTDGTGSGVASVTANVNNVTSGQTAVSLSTAGGPWTINSVVYNYRSASGALTSDNLADGAQAFTVNATDNLTTASGNTNNGSVTIDTTAPTVSSLVIANGASSTSKKLDLGDTITFGYNEANKMSAQSVSTGSISVTVTDGGSGNDKISIPGVGIVDTGQSSYVSTTQSVSATLVLNANNTLTLTFAATPTGAGTNVGNSTFVWTATGTTVTDDAGNAVVATGSASDGPTRF